MKKCYLLGLLIALFIGSCSDSESNKPTPPAETGKITVSTDTEKNPVLSADGGEYKLRFEATADWTASFSNLRAVDWISVEPTSGTAGSHTVTVKAAKNETYDERNATLELKCGSDRFTTSVTQKQKDALLVSSGKQEVSAAGGNLSIEVQANVEYKTEVDVDWIEPGRLKSLEVRTETFNVKPNETAEQRVGHIKFTAGELSETVTVYQAAMGSFIALTEKEKLVTAEAGQIKIELKSSVDFEYTITKGADWISESTLRSISTHTLYFDIAANESYDAREGEIVFKDTEEKGITDTVKVYQTYKGALILAKSQYDLPFTQNELTLEVQHNVEYGYTISAEWIHESSLKALETDKLHFTVDANEDKDREATITFESKDKSLKQVVYVHQAGKMDSETKSRAILVEFYEALGGENWTRKANWCTDAPLNEWEGVVFVNGVVTELLLSQNNLSGVIPDCLFDLTGLQYLSLSQNNLTGTLSPRFAELTNLKGLALSQNNLEGNIPAEWAALTGLEWLRLNDNRLSGEVPAEITSMPNYNTAIQGYYEIQQEGYGLNYLATTKMIDLGNNLYLHPEGWALEYRVPSLSKPNDAFFISLDKEIYRHFKDDFDFIFAVYDGRKLPTAVAGSHAAVQLDVEGVGRELFDQTSLYGSSGRLKGNIFLNGYRSIQSNGPFLHEVFHYWGGMDIGQEHGTPNGSYKKDDYHWGISSVDGSVGGFRLDLLQRNVDGDPQKYKAGCSAIEQYGEQNPHRFAQAGISNLYYPSLELYMMGLTPASEVEPIHIFKGVSAPKDTWDEGVFYAEREEIVTIDDIIAKHGARKPDYTTSQKDFRAMIVIVTDTPVGDVPWEVIINEIQNQEKQGAPTVNANFWTATGGRATLKLSGLAESRK